MRAGPMQSGTRAIGLPLVVGWIFGQFGAHRTAVLLVLHLGLTQSAVLI